jgi:hypothetical protein
MKVISKSAALKLLAESKNSPVNGKPLSKGKFDGGKYIWDGSQEKYIGRDVPDIEGVHAVYMERCQDAWGPFARAMCIHE